MVEGCKKYLLMQSRFRSPVSLDPAFIRRPAIGSLLQFIPDHGGFE